MDSENSVYGGAIQGASSRGLVGASLAGSQVKVGEVNSQLSLLGGSTERLQKMTGILEGKLEMVLRQVPDTNEAKEKEGSPSTQIGSVIFDNRNRVENVIYRLDSIIRRLEL